MMQIVGLFRSWSLVHWLVVSLMLCACKADEAPPRGQLMVVLQTDMSLPKDVTQVKIVIKVGDKPYHDKNYIIAPGENWIAKLPATLAVVASLENPTPVVDVQVVGLRQREARVFAHAITTIPERRTATLYVPIQWLCDGSVLDLKDAGYASTCEPKDGKPQACRAGSCEEVTVDEEDLDDYEEEDVFGGAELDSEVGLCFDTVRCFDAGFTVVPDADCVVEVDVPDGYALNLGLFNPSNDDGICSDDEEEEENPEDARCYIPLDRSSLFGWNYARGSSRDSEPIRAQLPPAVCEKLAAGDIEAVRATLACDTKTLQYPTCGPWSSVETAFTPGDRPPPPQPSEDAGVDATAPEEAGLPTNLAISFVDEEQPFEIGVAVDLQLNGEIADGGVVDLTPGAQWESSAPEVATVEDGVVTGQSAGEAQITATYMGEVVTFDVVVERGTPVSITVSGDGEPIPAGDTSNLVATATYLNDSTENITALAQWTSDDESIATVEGGKVTGIVAGDVNVIASFNGTDSAAYSVEISAAVLESIRIVNLGSVGPNSIQLGVEGTFTDDSVADVSDQADWQIIAGEEYATVSDTGVVTASAVGSVLVEVTVGTLSTTTNVTVVQPEADGGA